MAFLEGNGWTTQSVDLHHSVQMADTKRDFLADFPLFCFLFHVVSVNGSRQPLWSTRPTSGGTLVLPSGVIVDSLWILFWLSITIRLMCPHLDTSRIIIASATSITAVDLPEILRAAQQARITTSEAP